MPFPFMVSTSSRLAQGQILVNPTIPFSSCLPPPFYLFILSLVFPNIQSDPLPKLNVT